MGTPGTLATMQPPVASAFLGVSVRDFPDSLLASVFTLTMQGLDIFR